MTARNRIGFPSVTTTILEGHTDEVWDIEWSHDGTRLASGGKDKTAIIWKIGADTASTYNLLTLEGHPFSVPCIAWSTDDSVLLTSAENYIKLWDTKTGVCLRTVDEHSDTVTALSWLPDGSGFVSASLDRKIIHWDSDGKQVDSWLTATRIVDLAITPDHSRLITVGSDFIPTSDEGPATGFSSSDNEDSAADSANVVRHIECRMIVYDFATKQVQASISIGEEVTSVKSSQNSQYVLVNQVPNEVHLWDLRTCKLVRKYTGQRQGRHVIRSCFGGAEDKFVVSGSEDRNVYAWDRETGEVIDVLSGHGEGSVNSVSWNPVNERMFASCSDDNTVRIWEPPS